MNLRRSTPLLAAALALIPSVSPAQDAAPEKKKESRAPADLDIDRDIEYGKVGDLTLKLDLYRPKDRPKEPLPAVLYIHGGAWKSGDKAPAPPHILALARHGYAVASVNYRLTGVAPFPAQIEDCMCAVQWVRVNAARYGMDPDRIGAWGGSAGGHLVLLLGCADASSGLGSKDGPPGISTRVHAVCSWFGPADLVKAAREGTGRTGVLPSFLGGTLEEKPEAYKQASPVTHVTKDDPPVLMIHGDADDVVPIGQSEVMLEKLKEAGVEATLIRVKNAGHGFNPAEGPIEPSKEEITRATIEFFDKHLKGK